MKVLYDYQIFNMQRFGGISRYFYELIKNNNDVKTEIGIEYTDNQYLLNDKAFNFDSNPYTYENFLKGINFRGKRRLYNIRSKFLGYDEKKKSIELLKKGDFDVFHPTYYDPYFLDYIGNKPFVLTVHDMIHEIYPEMLLCDHTWVNKKKLCQRASKIIAISEKTKDDLKNIYDIPDEKISVIYHGSGLSQNCKDTIRKQIQDVCCQRNYFLFTGNRDLYKNFFTFIFFFSEVLLKHPNLKLICTGHPFSSLEIDLLKNLRIDDKVQSFFVNDNELSELYHNAIAFVYPSYYEGFGIPILEAFEANCPLILANASCFPEIAGDAALYFDPKDKGQLIDCCEKVISDRSLRENLIEKGQERLGNFSWTKCANQTTQVYKSLLM